MIKTKLLLPLIILLIPTVLLSQEELLGNKSGISFGYAQSVKTEIVPIIFGGQISYLHKKGIGLSIGRAFSDEVSETSAFVNFASIAPVGLSSYNRLVFSTGVGISENYKSLTVAPAFMRIIGVNDNYALSIKGGLSITYIDSDMFYNYVDDYLSTSILVGIYQSFYQSGRISPVIGIDCSFSNFQSSHFEKYSVLTFSLSFNVNFDNKGKSTTTAIN